MLIECRRKHIFEPLIELAQNKNFRNYLKLLGHKTSFEFGQKLA